MSEPKWRDEEVLRELFIQEGMTTYEIADELGCEQVTVSKWLKKNDIETDFQHHEKLRDEGWIKEQYYEKELSQHEIADKLGCAQMTVSRWMRKYGLETRKANYEKYGYHGFKDGYEIFSHRKCADDGGTVFIHRLIMVTEHGVESVKGQDVHHKNGVRWDNRPENLELIEPSEHISLHRSQ